jgi:hypothetical protein
MDLSCLLCIASISISGSLGVQSNGDVPYPDQSNHYGTIIGNVSLTIELENGLFGRIRHESGVNTFEQDNGLNAIEGGMRIYLYER